jgi:hypothetical protein
MILNRKEDTNQTGLLNVENYLVFSLLKADVQIRRILYGKRNYQWLL